MPRPSAVERYCPKCRQWEVYEKLYVRRGNRYIPIGRRCKICGAMHFDE